ncbi:MAG: hypothetical protein HQL70_05825 [Magnetococcales bacterium]|nr:hypothetical protein [Magnetococcales bacterium]
MNSTKLKKDQKGYSLIYQGSVLVNGLTMDDVFSIIPDLSEEDVQKVQKGHILAVKPIQKLSIQEIYNAKN